MAGAGSHCPVRREDGKSGEDGDGGKSEGDYGNTEGKSEGADDDGVDLIATSPGGSTLPPLARARADKWAAVDRAIAFSCNFHVKYAGYSQNNLRITKHERDRLTDSGGFSELLGYLGEQPSHNDPVSEWQQCDVRRRRHVSRR